MGNTGSCISSCTAGSHLDDTSALMLPRLSRPKAFSYASDFGYQKEEQDDLLVSLLPLELQLVHHKAKSNIEQDYEFLGVLSSHPPRTILEAEHRSTHTRVAVKRTNRKNLTAGDVERTLREAMILKKLENQYILSYEDFYKDAEFYYLVTEEVQGEIILEEDATGDKEFSEAEVRTWIRQLLQAVAHAHALRIVHRDIRVSNIMVTDLGMPSSSIRLLDWGCARVVADDQQLHRQLGHSGYMAPEVVTGGPYGRPCDLWSVGVVTYFLLVGYPPFHHTNVHEQSALFRTITSGYFVFDSPYWDHISKDAKDFISQLLRVNPAKRGTAAKMLGHRWFGAERSVTNTPTPTPRTPGGPTPRWRRAYDLAVTSHWLQGLASSQGSNTIYGKASPRVQARITYTREEQLEPETPGDELSILMMDVASCPEGKTQSLVGVNGTQREEQREGETDSDREVLDTSI